MAFQSKTPDDGDKHGRGAERREPSLAYQRTDEAGPAHPPRAAGGPAAARKGDALSDPMHDCVRRPRARYRALRRGGRTDRLDDQRDRRGRRRRRDGRLVRVYWVAPERGAGLGLARRRTP